MNYKDFDKIFIGYSDISTLILYGCYGNLKELHFGEDNSYQAYLVYGRHVEIGNHYNEVGRFYSWLKIYDDETLVRVFRAKEIVVYRAGEMGCIIQLIND